jgi:hypothetical protein
MLKQILIVATVLLSPGFSKAQIWKRLILNNEVSVEFPSLPNKKESGNNQVYLYKTEEYALMVGVAKNGFSNYKPPTKIDSAQQLKFANDFLNNIIDGKISYKNQSIVSIKTIKIGEYLGKEIVYLTGDAKNENSRERFTSLLLIKDTLYTFECWFLKKNVNSLDKDVFFKSILVKN